jgi:hypothetical protein
MIITTISYNSYSFLLQLSFDALILKLKGKLEDKKLSCRISTPTTYAFPNGSRCIFSAKPSVEWNTRFLVMSVKIHYTRFLFFFIIYLGINLLIIKIKSSDHIYDNITRVLKSHKSASHKEKLNNFNQEKSGKREKHANVSIFTKTVKIIPTEPMVTLHFTNAYQNSLVVNLVVDIVANGSYFQYNQKTVKQILDTCEENNLTTFASKRNFLYSFEHKGLYCWIRKVASTSFTKIFSYMNKRMVTRNYYKLNKLIFILSFVKLLICTFFFIYFIGHFREVGFMAPKTQDVLRDSNIFKLLVVRHPFERLVSAFR